MTITITINAETGEEAREKMAALLGASAPRLMPPLTDSDDEEMRAIIRAGMAHGQLLASANMTAPETAAEQAKEEPKKTRGRKPKAEEPQIRTSPENRVEAEAVEAEAVDDEATAAQDEADEQAEVEATRAPETPVTIDDLKKVVGEYVSAFSIPIAQEDGPKIFKSVLGEPPANSAWTFPVLAGLEQAKLASVVNAWKSAVADATTSKKRFGA